MNDDDCLHLQSHHILLLVKSGPLCVYVWSVRPGVRYREMGDIIQKHAQSNGFSVVRSYCGHGIHRRVFVTSTQ